MAAPDNLLILGAGIWQKPYLQQAQTMGCRVYACDWSVKPAAKQQANVFEQIDLNEGHNFGVQLSIPVFNGGSARNNVQRSKVNLERVKNQFRYKGWIDRGMGFR